MFRNFDIVMVNDLSKIMHFQIAPDCKLDV
jgi:hypothetical protein